MVQREAWACPVPEGRRGAKLAVSGAGTQELWGVAFMLPRKKRSMELASGLLIVY